MNVMTRRLSWFLCGVLVVLSASAADGDLTRREP